MKSLRKFVSLVTLRSALITGVALGTTYLCRYFDIAAEIPTALVGVAIVFPIVFSINAAYTRRENILRSLAKIKSSLMNIYHAHSTLYEGDDQAEKTEKIEELIYTLLCDMEEYFVNSSYENEQGLDRVYEGLDAIMESIATLKGNVGGFSRYLQSHRTANQEFEKMRNVLLYRTPSALRSYSYFFLNIFPIAFAPYFVYLGNEYFIGLGYGVAIFYSAVLASLDKIQDDLEDPFDQEGLDDIRFETDEQVENAMNQ